MTLSISTAGDRRHVKRLATAMSYGTAVSPSIHATARGSNSGVTRGQRGGGSCPWTQNSLNRIFYD